MEERSLSPEEIRLYIGGKTLAAYLLYTMSKPGMHPFDAEMPLIINTGPLVATGAPAAGRFNVTTKSPLTGGIASSNCGGHFGYHLRRAGLDGLIIQGRSPSPVYLEVKAGTVSFHDASHLWGLDTEQTQNALPARTGKMVIGPAGENGVYYASIVSQERVAGRCGTGAVMGAKNLKAITAQGSATPPLARAEAFKKDNRAWIRRLKNHPMTGTQLPRYGTMGFVEKTGPLGLLPVKNFSQAHFPEYEKLSGQYYARHYLTKNTGCITCPIRCARQQKLKGRDIKGPEYETVGLLGSNLLNSDLESIAGWNHWADLMGMDTISLGGTLSFAMELKEKGVADLGVDYGDLQNVEAMIRAIAHGQGAGKELGRGSEYLGKTYGHLGSTAQARGLEMAAYDPRRSVGMGLGYATANRGGCHLNGGYLVYLEGLGPLALPPQSTRGKAALTILMQNMMEAISSSGSCLFTSLALFSAPLHKAPSWLKKALAFVLAGSSMPLKLILPRPHLLFGSFTVPYPRLLGHVLGQSMSLGTFLEAGERGFTLERLYNLRENGTEEKDELTQRFLAEPQIPGNPKTTVPLSTMLSSYYTIRGWDTQGRPQAGTLQRLQLPPQKQK